MESLRTLLNGLIDYAGLFPPAQLDMLTSVRNYASYRTSEYNWMLGRFIVPVGRLSEFEQALAGTVPPTAAGEYRISALLSPCSTPEIEVIQAFNERHAQREHGPWVIDSVEIKVSTPDQIAESCRLLPKSLASYFEFPLAASRLFVEEIAAADARAKIRTGGVTADLIPSASEIAGFMQHCLTCLVPFKATAGLHHPIRSVHPLTYQKDSPSSTMHGFLNVFLGAAFMKFGLPVNEVVQLLQEENAPSFSFEDSGVFWLSHRLDTPQLQFARQTLAISFGSCSFEEPIFDLKDLKLL